MTPRCLYWQQTLQFLPRMIQPLKKHRGIKKTLVYIQLEGLPQSRLVLNVLMWKSMKGCITTLKGTNAMKLLQSSLHLQKGAKQINQHPSKRVAAWGIPVTLFQPFIFFKLLQVSPHSSKSHSAIQPNYSHYKNATLYAILGEVCCVV